MQLVAICVLPYRATAPGNPLVSATNPNTPDAVVPIEVPPRGTPNLVLTTNNTQPAVGEPFLVTGVYTDPTGK
jgi:hypothetical protein